MSEGVTLRVIQGGKADEERTAHFALRLAEKLIDAVIASPPSPGRTQALHDIKRRLEEQGIAVTGVPAGGGA